jgi:hypothetical protein
LLGYDQQWIEPSGVAAGPNVDPREPLVSFAWTEGEFCTGQFSITVTETNTEVRLGPVHSKRLRNALCPGMSAQGTIAHVTAHLRTPIGSRRVVRASDGVPLVVSATG